jgi:hypothetical protein
MKPLNKLALLLAISASFTLNSCKSSTESDDNNGGNNGGNGNTGQIAVGNTYTNEVYVTDETFTPMGSPTQSATGEIESINSTWMGRTNVIVSSSPQQPGQKGYQVIESNGDVSIYAPMVGGPQGVLMYRWVRFPVSGSGETLINIDTTVELNTIPTRITGEWRIRPTGTGTADAAGKTWNVQKIEMDQTTTWEFFGVSFSMSMHTDYSFSKDLMLAVRSDITTTQNNGGFDQNGYQTVRLKSYTLK